MTRATSSLDQDTGILIDILVVIGIVIGHAQAYDEQRRRKDAEREAREAAEEEAAAQAEAERQAAEDAEAAKWVDQIRVEGQGEEAQSEEQAQVRLPLLMQLW
jgi:hypothetical protein